MSASGTRDRGRRAATTTRPAAIRVCNRCRRAPSPQTATNAIPVSEATHSQRAGGKFPSEHSEVLQARPLPNIEMLGRRQFITAGLATSATLLTTSQAMARSAGSYQVAQTYRPNATGGVDQSLAKSTWSYRNDGGKGWWWCGHAALASAINFMRGKPVSTSKKVEQLQWLHERLTARQGGAHRYVSDPNRQASLDGMMAVVNQDKFEEFSARKITSPDRAYVRDELLDTLRLHSSYAIALMTIEIGGRRYGHFVALYKIDYQPGTRYGGTAHYWDPYAAAERTLPLAKLLDGMLASGGVPTSRRHSFVRLHKRHN